MMPRARQLDTVNEDLDFITDRLATGGYIRSMRQIAELGITHVINTQYEREDARLPDSDRVTILWLPQDDDGEPRSVEQIRLGVSFAMAAFSDASAKVLAHCGGGCNRGPTMAYAILRALGMSRVNAATLIRQTRTIIAVPHHGFYDGKRYLDDVDRALEGWHA